MSKHLFYIGNGWDQQLEDEFNLDYCKKLEASVENEYQKFKVYPSKADIFAALKCVDYDKVKVCILGQDPYHGAGQANGMAFAVCEGVAFPPSLGNIFKELCDDFGIGAPSAGTLTGWANQGVLLLNATLTVRESQPLSHAGFGWGRLTDAIIQKLSKRKEPMVFILWGASAISKAKIIASHHCIIQSPHPSPLSAHRGFFGSKPFSRANEFLRRHKIQEIDWTKVNEKEPAIPTPQADSAESVKAKGYPDSPVLPQSLKTAKAFRERADYYKGTGSITKI